MALGFHRKLAGPDVSDDAGVPKVLPATSWSRHHHANSEKRGPGALFSKIWGWHSKFAQILGICSERS
jgi:hypothetical protein